MTPHSSPDSIDELLTHKDWVSSLARSLASDQETAEDISQEAWLAALKNPPRPETSRAWFCQVLRSQATRQTRRDSMRRDRERQSVSPEGSHHSGAAQERAQMLQQVVEMTLELEEPYRGAILMRYIEELPPRDIALRLGVPLNTVTSRLQRALEQLRQKLRREHGDRTWANALMVLILRPADLRAYRRALDLPWLGGACSLLVWAASWSLASAPSDVAFALAPGNAVVSEEANTTPLLPETATDWVSRTLPSRSVAARSGRHALSTLAAPADELEVSPVTNDRGELGRAAARAPSPGRWVLAGLQPRRNDFEDLRGTATPLPAGYGGVADWGSWAHSDASDPWYSVNGRTRMFSVGSQSPIRTGQDIVFGGANVVTAADFSFELYYRGSLIHTTEVVTPNIGGAPVWLASGYSGLIDELRYVSSINAFGVDDFSYALALDVSPFCMGDGSGLACPCSNMGVLGEGCSNSTGSGATLAAAGTTSVGADDLTLAAAGLPPLAPCLLFSGTTQENGGLGVLFGDGLRCAGGSTQRLGMAFAGPAGHASWGPGLASPGAWSAGEKRYLQVWYRDPGGSCGSGFNASQALEATFAP